MNAVADPAFAPDASNPADPLALMGPDDALTLFDGTCHFCDGSVRFLFARDRHRRIWFAPLQSALGRRLATRAGLDPDQLGTMVVLYRGRFHLRSSAGLTLVGRLPFPWPILGLFRIVPRPIRDWVYSFIAHRRYRWFGQSETCLMPTPELRRRFLDLG
jgi:predicted DCC family thiol-disulfide oxidoreductase YuxK